MNKLRDCMIFGALLLASCAHRPVDDPADPLEPVNRAVFSFNTKADHYVLRPAAKGYVAVTPDWTRKGVSNFFDNLFYPKTIVNDLLQAKFTTGLSDTGRFLTNTIFGIGGVMDVGTRWGLPKHDEDFGQTLGYWGVGEGWFLMLPLLGPSDNRDLVGYAAGIPLNPVNYLPSDYDWLKLSLSAGNLVNQRANLLPTDSLVESQLDPYLAVRTAYLQRRQALVYDGNPPMENLQLGDDGDGAASAANAGADTRSRSGHEPMGAQAPPAK